MSKVAVITGGARRIGSVAAQHMHNLGYDIALHYRNSRTDAEDLAARLNAKRSNSCEIFQGDFDDLNSIQTMCENLRKRYSAIELVVNNASGFEPTPIATCTPQQFDGMLNSNLRGPYFFIQGILPAMSKGASIVNLLDVHIDRPLRDFNVYGAAKAGMASITRSLAVELAPHIRVNGIAPGAILWPEGDVESDPAYDASMRERTISASPLQRLGDPMDIARTIEFLACAAPFITGQVITVDGGRCLSE